MSPLHRSLEVGFFAVLMLIGISLIVTAENGGYDNKPPGDHIGPGFDDPYGGPGGPPVGMAMGGFDPEFGPDFGGDQFGGPLPFDVGYKGGNKPFERFVEGPRPMVMPPVFPEHIPVEEIFSANFGYELESRMSFDELKENCQNQDNFVEAIYAEIQKEGIDFQEDFCGELEEGLERCKQSEGMCEQIKQNQDGMSCPPSQEQMVQMCLDRMSEELSIKQQHMEEDLPLICEKEWIFNEKHFKGMCEQEEFEKICTEEEFLKNCMERTPPQPDWPVTGPDGMPPHQSGPWPTPYQQPPGTPTATPPGDYYPDGTTPTATETPPEGEPTSTDTPTATEQPPESTETPPEPTPDQSTPTNDQPPADTTTSTTTEGEGTSPATGGFTVGRFWNVLSGLFTGGSYPKEPIDFCREQWEENKEHMLRGCEKPKYPFGATKEQLCSLEGFMEACKANINKEFDNRFLDADQQRRICEIEMKMNRRKFEEFCKYQHQGYEMCVEKTRRGCEFVEKQLTSCKELTTETKVREMVRKNVKRYCSLYKYRPSMDIREYSEKVAKSETLPVIIAVKEGISEEQRSQIIQLTENVRGTFEIAGLAIISANVKADNMQNLRELNFVEEVKLDPITRSAEEAKFEKIDKSIAVLTASKEVLSDDYKPWVEVEAAELAEVNEKIKKSDEGEKKKGIDYHVAKFFGMKAEQEKKEAEEQKKHAAELAASVQRLEELANQVEDLSVRGALLEQINALKERKTAIESTAKAKEDNAGGLFDALGNIFG